ncbi:MAG: zinc-binding alcohol dehydrogenase [Methylothermaceae bacterium]|nr:zinc-binding alcohol dehydrogenase [Methylothermaceae bacterium]
MNTRVLLHTAPGKVEVVERTLPPPGAGQVVLRSLCSAISPGTESLVFSGRLSEDLPLDETLASLSGSFRHPFPYGYSLVGEVIETGPGVEPAWRGRRLFAFHPHQSQVVVPVEECLAVPEDLTPEDAMFLPNMESALNFVQDAAPLAGERAAVFGLGIVGLLTTAMLKRFPLDRLMAMEPVAARRAEGARLGAETVDPLDPGDWNACKRSLEEGIDVAIELSGNMQGLQQAIDLTGFAGRVVIGSWYGQPLPLTLGGRFHRSRIRLLASQVSTLDPAIGGRWSKARRYRLAWEMLREIQPARWITRRFPLEEAQQAFESLKDTLQPVFFY